MTRRATRFSGKSRVSVDEARAADVNNLMAQYRKHGTMPAVSLHNPLYGDFSGPQDLQSQLEAVQAAYDVFNELPASVRTAADNDPVRFLEMFDNPDERVMLEDAGLQVFDTPLSKTDTQPPASPTGKEAAGSEATADHTGSEG